MPTLDPGKLTQLRSFYGDEFLAELACLYLEDSARLTSRLEAALAGSDRDGLVSSAHDLKSTSAQLGAMQVSEAARRIERSARAEESFETLKHLVEAFLPLYQDAVLAIKDL